MTNHRNIALFVEQRLPLTQNALLALCTYLEQSGWTKKSEWEYEKREWAEDEEPLVVRIPATISTPIAIEASEAFRDILLVLSSLQNTGLDEIITQLQAVISRSQVERSSAGQWASLETPTFVEVMRKHVTAAQIAAILREFAEAEDSGRCSICGTPDIPVDEQGNAVDAESPAFAAYQERHSANCLIKLLTEG